MSGLKTVEQARAEMVTARAALDAFTAAQRTSDDPAVARLGATALRQHHRNTDRDLARYVELRSRVSAAEFAFNRAETREREANRTRLTVDEVRGARAVRDRHGWHRVVRVNAKTVTVETGYSWTDRIAIGDVLEVAA